MNDEGVKTVRRLGQQYAYVSLQMHETVARKAGLAGTDHKYLGFFLEKGEMTAGELSNLTGLTTGAVTGLIDRFEKRDLVKRRFAPEDRRKVIIVANTENIMALLAPLYKDFRSKTEEMLASFSDADSKVIEAYFNKAIEIAKETTEQLNKQ